MNRINPRDSILKFGLVGVLVAGTTMAADLRYQNSGDYNDTLAVTGVNGWLAGGGGPGGLPGELDTARCNWGNNIVTLTNEAPVIRRFQLGVDESGQLVVNSGGRLKTTGGANSTVGNNGGAAVVGRLTVNEGGEVNVTNVLFVGASATGILTIDGGKVTVSSHLWSGTTATGAGTTYVTNGGVLSIGGNIGLGTINASTPSGGSGRLYVQDNGVLNLTTINGSGNSVQPGSSLDISGSGVVTIPGDFINVMSAYTNANKITAYGGAGTVGIDYNNTNAGKTTLWAIQGEVVPLETVWNPAANPSGSGLWNEGANWTGSVRPGGITKVIFNVPGAIPCTVANAALANHVVMGDSGPGGTLIVTNGGILTCGSEIASVIGYNSNALMKVEDGATVSFGHELWVGLNPDSDGTLIMNGGTVSVAGNFGIGYMGGKGTVRINGGTLNLAQWGDVFTIQGESVLDVAGTGKVVVNGDQRASVEYFVTTGQIKANGGAGTVVVDYNVINVGKTTIYPFGLDLPPAQATWNPALNFPDVDGLWNVRSNWSSALVPGNTTIVTFNVPDAIPCLITNAAIARYVAMGINGGPGGTLIVTNGGSLTTGGDNWTAVGYNSTALMIIAPGGAASFGEHLWVGLNPGSDGTFIMNGGTVSVGAMFGLGWLGGKGTAQINAGTLNLSQLHPTDSIKGESVLNITGTGTVIINGNQLTPVANYISAGKITANGGSNVAYSYDSGANKTTLQVAPSRQSVKTVSVAGGTTTITYETTPGHIYHLESTPSLSPAAWTRVAGSTTNATGTAVSFSFPADAEQSFYRTASP